MTVLQLLEDRPPGTYLNSQKVNLLEDGPPGYRDKS